MGYIYRAIKNELLSLSMIFLVFIPMLNGNSGHAMPSSQDLASSFTYISSDAPAQDVKQMFRNIGQAEANEVMRFLPVDHGSTLVVNHAPIFLTGTEY
jgi:hypothetical protein